MKRSPSELYVELIKRQLASLRILSKELRECRTSFISMDLDATRGHISYQQGLCSEMRFLDGELASLRRQIAEAAGVEPGQTSADEFAKLLEAGSASQLRQVKGELTSVANDVRRLNRVYGGLIRRSRRSINVLINVMASYMGTYGPSARRNSTLFARHTEM